MYIVYSVYIPYMFSSRKTKEFSRKKLSDRQYFILLISLNFRLLLLIVCYINYT